MPLGRRPVASRAAAVAGHSSRCARTACEPVVAGEPLVRRARRAGRARPRAVHHGHRDGVVERHHGIVGHPLQQLVQRQDLRPVGVLGAGRPRRAPPRSRPGAGTGRSARADRAPVTSATPSAISSRSQRLRSCSSSGISSPSGPVRAGAAGVGEQHQREQPGDLAVVGQQPVQLRASRIASADRSGALQVAARRCGVALVEDQVEHVQHGASRRPRSGSAGIRNGTPLALMRCLARLIRWAMVASGTRKARAISAVVRPPTARSVSAICEAASARDGST